MIVEVQIPPCVLCVRRVMHLWSFPGAVKAIFHKLVSRDSCIIRSRLRQVVSPLFDIPVNACQYISLVNVHFKSCKHRLRCADVYVTAVQS